MSITLKNVENMAALSKFYLTDEEYSSMRTDMENIVSSFDELLEIDVSNVPPTTSLLPIVNVFRADEIIPSLATDDLLKNAKYRDDQYFLVPRIIE